MLEQPEQLPRAGGRQGQGRGTHHGAESRVICALLEAVQRYLVFFHLQMCRSSDASEKRRWTNAGWGEEDGITPGKDECPTQLPVLGPVLGLQEECGLCRADAELFRQQHVEEPPGGVLKPWGWRADFLLLP